MPAISMKMKPAPVKRTPALDFDPISAMAENAAYFRARLECNPDDDAARAQLQRVCEALAPYVAPRLAAVHLKPEPAPTEPEETDPIDLARHVAFIFEQARGPIGSD